MSFQYKGKAKEIAEKIVRMFERGDIAKPLGYVFLNFDSSVPMFKWSTNNVLGCVYEGMIDARTFNQWVAVGRCVKKGEKSPASILIPFLVKKDKNDPESPRILVGFGSKAVFDVTQTEGDDLPPEQMRNIMLDRPLKEVAEHWGLTVKAAIAVDNSAGSYNRKEIRLSVENTSTWLHELVHAADDRAGNLKVMANTWANETVAELGSATLATMIGEENVDTGKAYRYIKYYAEKNEMEMITACTHVLDRVAIAVGLIMDEAAKLGLAGDFFAHVDVETETAVI
jgi:hypothetical protein